MGHVHNLVLLLCVGVFYACRDRQQLEERLVSAFKRFYSHLRFL